MRKTHSNELKMEIKDYSSFSYVLLALSILLYIGSFIVTISDMHKLVLQIISYTSIFGAIYFLRKSKRLKNKLEDDDQYPMF